MNAVQLIGRLTQDPEADKTPTGKSVCRMRLAVPGPTKEAQALFVDVETWNKLAETCDKHLEKGRRVSVTGRLAHDQWETRAGEKRQRHYVVASDVGFLDARSESSGTTGGVEPVAEPASEAGDDIPS